MYSGEESSRDALNSTAAVGNWQLSQSAFNMPKDQVDWAALAQQWIQMKESCANTPCPNTRPPTMVNFEEKGEAPMEVVKEEDTMMIGHEIMNNSTADVHRYLREWQQPPWYSAKSLWRPGWNPWPANNTAPIPQQDIITPPIPPANILKGSNSLLPEKNHDKEISSDPVPTMDAAKRKTLPAWIREGLEKMEKEKQKQLERQKEIQQEKEMPNNPKKINVSPEHVTNETRKIKTKESFEESDNSDDEEGTIEPEDNNKSKIPVTVTKTREEWMEEWMLVVRRSLTELLLEVTNEEILNVAQEQLKKNKLKASSAQVFRKSAISSITGKLGLGAYADSASENSESEEENVEEGKYDRDSEDEIKESIKNRQNAFKAIAQEIEQTVNEVEQKEQRRNAEHNAEVKESVKKGFDKDSGETQPDKKMNINGKRNRERTSRFSDVKDSKHKSSSSYIFQTAAIPSSSTEYEKRKTNVMPRQYSYSSDTSSDSSDSYKNRKRKNSKERKHRSNNSKRESSRNSSDSDDYSRRRRYRSSYSRDRTRSRSRSRSHTRKQRY